MRKTVDNPFNIGNDLIKLRMCKPGDISDKRKDSGSDDFTPFLK